jgi:hypothetical protein
VSVGCQARRVGISDLTPKLEVILHAFTALGRTFASLSVASARNPQPRRGITFYRLCSDCTAESWFVVQQLLGPLILWFGTASDLRTLEPMQGYEPNEQNRQQRADISLFSPTKSALIASCSSAPPPKMSFLCGAGIMPPGAGAHCDQLRHPTIGSAGW